METPQIYTSINAVMKDIGYIGKDKKNQQQNFMFRGIDQVMNTMKPVLEKHGVFIVPEILDTTREERTTKSGGTLIYTVHKIKYHFIATDGSEVCATVIGEGMDSADKSSNKAMAVAFKYACFQVFCIPTEEMAKDDPDAYSPEESTKKQETKGALSLKDRIKNFLNKLDASTLQQYLLFFNIDDVEYITDEQAKKIADYIKEQQHKK